MKHDIDLAPALTEGIRYLVANPPKDGNYMSALSVLIVGAVPALAEQFARVAEAVAAELRPVAEPIADVDRKVAEARADGALAAAAALRRAVA
ncbi:MULTISPECIES: hypothetical protein [unclassified Cryobacterium]|uniref:hypothetical protein n=1 Tax=unclassified Cryobacterium TaxID=2649013 RepID=UPI002AB3CEDB|nr:MULTISPECIES: hypothetical protein [unclassified Cryobacterium]MDY7528466.1 hypothetical protein [Cryobacterium sp. 10C2]MDY7555789.1 hypothetical protein [Cryobacterium sp. 10C3]MEB0289186.1 hypothetical protein [Cryobacterium sp. 10C2]